MTGRIRAGRLPEGQEVTVLAHGTVSSTPQPKCWTSHSVFDIAPQVLAEFIHVVTEPADPAEGGRDRALQRDGSNASMSAMWHSNCVHQSRALQVDSSSGSSPVNYYQVSLRGRPVAVVRTIELAQKIVRCRRRGYYAIEAIELDERIPTTAKRHPKTPAARRSVNTASHHRRLGARKALGKSPTAKSRRSR
jgi:hypothetical protein